MHEIAVGEVGEVGGQRQPLQSLLSFGRGHSLLVDLPLQEVRDPVARGGAELVRHLTAYGLVAGFDRQLRDPGAHGTEAHDADSTDLRHGHDRRDPTGASGAVSVGSSAAVAAPAGDFVNARIRAGEVRERYQSDDECDENQSEHDLMMQDKVDQYQSGTSAN